MKKSYRKVNRPLVAKLLIIFREHGLFILMLLLAAIVRFYRLEEMASFDFDQEYAAGFAYDVLRVFPVRMIGQGLSVQGLFMGPFYFYFLVPFFALFNLHPLGGAVGSVIISLATIVAYYYCANKFFGKPAGLITVFIRSLLFSYMISDWAMVPAYGCELMVLATWDLFHEYWKGKTNKLPLLALIFGLYTSFHPVLFPFYFVFLGLLVIKRTFPNFRTFFYSVGGFLLPVTPLIAFEYFRKFYEVKRLFGLVSGAEPGALGLTKLSLSRYFLILAGELNFGFRPWFGRWVLPVVAIALVLIFLKKLAFGKERFHLIGLMLGFSIFFIYYRYLPVNISEYYFIGMKCLLFFYFCGILSLLTRSFFGKMFTLVFLGWLLFINVKILDGRWRNTVQITLLHKDNIVLSILNRQPKDKKFSVTYINRPGWNFGFEYLFRSYDRIPEKDFVDGSNYTIVIPKELSLDSLNVVDGNIGLIYP